MTTVYDEYDEKWTEEYFANTPDTHAYEGAEKVQEAGKGYYWTKGGGSCATCRSPLLILINEETSLGEGEKCSHCSHRVIWG